MKWLIAGNFSIALISILISAFILKELEVSDFDAVERRIITQENELKELEADLGCEANNYMRSKQEMKLMRNQVKKLKQQVAGLRRKVENEKREREREQREKEDALKKETEEEEEEEENGGDFFGGGGFFADADEDEEEEAENVEETTETNDFWRILGFLGVFFWRFS